MIHAFEKALRAADYIRAIIGDVRVDYALVTGTGLGEVISDFELIHAIPYKQIPHMVISTAPSHHGTLKLMRQGNRHVLVLLGRLHYYEGYTMQEITFPIRVLKALEVENLILTNVAGGCNPHFNPGDIVLVTDHINMMGDNPLRGQNEDRWGVRFPDCANVYSKNLINRVKNIATLYNVYLWEGVYLALQGPSLETPAEYKMIYRLGADLVGMSTVPEALVANHMGMQVACFSIVSNVCYPQSRIEYTTVESVVENARKAIPELGKLVSEIVDN